MSRIQAILKLIQFDTIKILLFIAITTILAGKALDYYQINNKTWILLIQQLVLCLPLAIAIISKKTSFNSMGFAKFKPLSDLLLIIKLYGLFIITSILVNLITLKFNLVIPGLGQQPNYPDIFSGLSLTTIFIFVVILAPILEELLFRGLIFNKIYGSNTTKIIISSVVFAGIHFQFQVFIPLLTLGLIIGYLRYKTNSIFPAIIFHALNNFITFIAIKSLL
jgi:membrane protease YdiL (CAAX protease family)